MKLTMLGPGVRAPFVLRGLAASQGELGLDEVVLHDTDPERLELMTALGGHLCAEWGAGFTVRGEADARAAVADARFVFSAIRPGQEARPRRRRGGAAEARRARTGDDRPRRVRDGAADDPRDARVRAS